MKNVLSGLSLSIITIVIMLGISEVTIRQFLDPLDYLSPTLISDAELGHRIAANSGGHDAWGYRNKTVPHKARIVIIGDSQIYGTASTSESSIASLLHKKLGYTVYNMGIGGYGPAHYSILLDRAFELSPKMVLLGLYFGNDFMDAFNYVYDQDHTRFSLLRQSKFSGVDTFKPVEFEPPRKKLFGATRDYLARHSVFYRVLTAKVDFIRRLRKYEQRNSNLSILEIKDKNGDLSIGIPLTHRTLVDARDSRIEEGVRLTLHFIDDIKRRCDINGVTLGVILFPTPLSVYALEIASDPVFSEEAWKALKDEGLLFSRFHSILSQKNINTIDIRKPLLDAVGRGEKIYPFNDVHPNNHGNDVIATYIGEQLATINSQ